MKKLFFAAAALVLGATTPSFAQAAQPVLKGYWQLVLCLNPDKLCNVTGPGLCAQFTKVPGHVGQLPNSGTWKLAGASTLIGKWFQHGDLVQFYGSYNTAFISFTGLLNGASRMGGISFIDGPVASANMTTGTWHGQKKASCALSGTRAQANRPISDPD